LLLLEKEVNLLNSIFSFLNSNIVERLLNKYTPKGIVHLGVALVLYYVGFSEKFIETSMNYNWNPVVKMFADNKTLLAFVIVGIVLFAGFNIFRKDYSSIRNHLITFEHKKLEVEDRKLDLKLKSLEVEKKEVELKIFKKSIGEEVKNG